MLNRLLSPRSLRIVPLAVGGVAASAAFGWMAAGGVPAPAAPPVGIHSAPDLTTAFERVARELAPSVVSITSASRVQAPPRATHPFFGTPFDDLFGQMAPRVPQDGMVQRGLGSGLIVSEDGFVLTNNHVVRGADELTVTLSDGRELRAELIGADPETDLAVLHVEDDGLTPARLGTSADLAVGQWVAAIGNPFGLTSSMTAGVVSAIGRSGLGLAGYEAFIQTDAAINRGNSGGPLVDLDGEVVGINTAIFSRTGGNMGIGFAIPIDMAQSVLTSLIETGGVQRGLLGVRIQNLDEGLAESFGRSDPRGALIGEVIEDSPADEAGLRAGDIVLAMNGRKIRNRDELRFRVASTHPGTAVTLAVFRDGEEREVEVVLGSLDGETTLAPSRDDGTAAPALGMSVQTPTERQAEALSLPQGEGGALVTRVDPNGLAAQAGILPQDVVLAVGRRQVQSAEDFEKAMEEVDLAEGVRLTLRTQGVKRFVFLREGR